MEKIIYKIGQQLTVHNQKCSIIRVWDFGTVDVKTIGGERYYRVTGLKIYQ